MKHTVVISVMLASSGAFAQPRPSKPVPPKKPPPCGPVIDANVPEYRLALAGADPVGCWKPQGKPEICVAITATGATRSVPAPPVVAEPAPAEIRKNGVGKLVACAGTKCVKVGTKLAKAIAKYNAKAAKPDFIGSGVQVSTDLKLAAVDSEPWSVKADKKLKLKAPDYDDGGDKLEGGGIDILGNFATSGWGNCAGPCGVSVVIDTAGKNKGEWFPSGVQIALDDNRVAVAASEAEGKLTVIDVKTAKQLQSVVLSEGAIEGTRVVKIDPMTLAVMWEGMDDDWKVSFVSLKPEQKPTVTTKSIPTCPYP